MPNANIRQYIFLPSPPPVELMTAFITAFITKRVKIEIREQMCIFGCGQIWRLYDVDV